MTSLDAVRQARSPIMQGAVDRHRAFVGMDIFPTSMTHFNLPMTGAQGDAYVASYFPGLPRSLSVCFLLHLN